MRHISDRMCRQLKGVGIKMETRVALMGIIVENKESVAGLNALLHEYGDYIIGRMGVPYREKHMNIISVVIDAPQEKISALSGKVGMLSGGNIQKVVVAREFSADPILIIADQPTRGIDVGATEFIRKKLVELSRAGAAVLLVSADLNEVMELSDSLIIMYNGGIAAYFEDTTSLTDAVMGEYMLGLKQQSDEEVRRVQHGE